MHRTSNPNSELGGARFLPSTVVLGGVAWGIRQHLQYLSKLANRTQVHVLFLYVVIREARLLLRTGVACMWVAWLRSCRNNVICITGCRCRFGVAVRRNTSPDRSTPSANKNIRVPVCMERTHTDNPRREDLLTNFSALHHTKEDVGH